MQCIGKGEKDLSFSYALHKEKREMKGMLSPKTYNGYDAQGNHVSYATAVDANEYINPAEVKTAIDNVKSAFEQQFRNIATSLRDISTDAEEAVIVQGTNMGGAIDDTASLLIDISGQVTEGIDGLYDLAVSVHDEIQQQANDMARQSCYTNGAVTVY